MKRLICLLLSLLMLFTAAASFADDSAPEPAPANPADETAEQASEDAPARTDAPVLFATANGREITSDDYGYKAYLDYYLDTLAQYGLVEGEEDYPYYYAVYQNMSLSAALQHVFYLEKAQELSIETDPAEREEYEKSVRDSWESAINDYMDDEGITEDSSEEDRDAARADAVAYFSEYFGYTEESYISTRMEEYDYFGIHDKVEEELTKDVTVSEEEIVAYFNELVEEDRQNYEGDVGSYEFATKFYQQSSYYIPDGYRAVTHILLKPDESLMNIWKDLAARLEEQDDDEDSEPTDGADEGETAAEAAPETTAVPVTQEMVDAARRAVIASVQSVVDEIMAKLKDGASFDDLIVEYGVDEEMQDADYRAAGYFVHQDSLGLDPAVISAVMALENVGDVTEPVLSDEGVQILKYLRDVPGGAVELTDAIRQELLEVLRDEADTQHLTDLFDAWKAASDIQYTPEGQAVVDAAEKASAYLMASADEEEEQEEEAEEDSEEAPGEADGEEEDSSEAEPAGPEAPADEQNTADSGEAGGE